MNPKRLCIDFGSAYTKVGLRSDWDATTELFHDRKLNLDQLHFCIPSVVAIANRQGEKRFTTGLSAVDHKNQNSIQVFRNWKKQLFSSSVRIPNEKPQPVPVLSGSGHQGLKNLVVERKRLLHTLASMHDQHIEDIRECFIGYRVKELRELVSESTEHHPHNDNGTTDTTSNTVDLEIREVALHFFQSLFKLVHKAWQQEGIDISQIPTRLCTPGFRSSRFRGETTQEEDYMIELLSESGWTIDQDSPIIAEPIANAIGVLTEGKNQTWFPGAASQRRLNRGEMFEGTWYQEAKKDYLNYHLHWSETSREYQIVVVDVGAFTTDFALLSFDLFEENSPPSIQFNSVPLGIAQLDERVATTLPKSKSDGMSTLTMRNFEILKRTVYSEKRPYEFHAGVIGEGEELDQIQETIRSFGKYLGRELDSFLSTQSIEHLEEAVLTGGGNIIPTLASSLAGHLTQYNPKVVRSPIRMKGVQQIYHQLPEQMPRGGSAIGGASVLFDTLKEEKTPLNTGTRQEQQAKS